MRASPAVRVKAASSRMVILIFGLALTLLFTNAVLHGTGLLVDAGKNMLRLAALGCFVLCCALNFSAIRFNVLELAIIAFSALAALGGRGDALNILMVVLMGISVRVLPRQKMLKWLALSALAAIALLIALNLSGMASDRAMMAHYAGGGDRLRHTLGFSNPNAATLICAGLLFLPLATGSRRWQWALCGLALVAICWYTDTRSILFFLVILLVLALLTKRLVDSGKMRLLAIASAVSIVAALTLTAAVPLLAGTSLDYTFSYRPSIARELIGGLSASEFFLGATGSVSIDNSYLLLLASGGVVLVILFTWFMAKSLWQASLAGDYLAVSFMMATIALGLFESFLFRPELALCAGFWALAFIYTDPERAGMAAGRRVVVHGSASDASD